MQIPNNVLTIGSVIAIIAGLAFCFQGYRLFKYSLKAVGFGLGAMLGAGATLLLPEPNALVAAGAGFVGGMISWGFANRAFNMGLFIAGFALGAVVSVGLFVVFDTVNLDRAVAILPVGLLASLVMGFLFVLLEKPIIQLGTAYLGATAVAIGIWLLFLGIEQLPRSIDDAFTTTMFIFVGGIILLGSLGAVLQFFGLKLFDFMRGGDSPKPAPRPVQRPIQQQPRPAQPPQQPYPSQRPQQRRSASPSNPQQPRRQRPAQSQNPQRRQNPYGD